MDKNHRNFSLHQLIDRKNFDTLAKKWGVDKGVRNFSTWEMTQALISCFVMRLHSYREVESALKIPDSTFGDAIRTRTFGFFQDLCDQIFLQIRARTERRKIKRAINEILAMDSSECRVHGSLFNYPLWRPKDCRSRKAAVKLHVVWNIKEQWIEDFRITGVRRNDLTVAKGIQLSRGKIYVFDRGYVDLGFWLSIMKAESHFVTRLKKSSRKENIHRYVLRNKEVGKKIGVLWEGEWTPSEAICYQHGLKPKELKLRHVIFRDDQGRLYDFITSDFVSTAEEIAEVYKKRWSVELLFRWLKGHLDIRYLPVRNKNAVKVQLAIAILVQLLLQLKRIVEQYRGTLWELLRQMRTEIIQKILTGCGVPDDCRWKPAPILGPTS